MTQIPELTQEKALEAIKEVIAQFDLTENEEKMKVAKEEAGSDLQKMLQIVMPVAIEIQKPIAKKYGFTEDQLGLTQFTMAIKKWEATNEEIKKYGNQLKAKYMPKMN
ncbi:protein c10 [Anaeramoeba flamelloides]|uniref:Protein C10 n=1 Tax=Anaeramoeba flamelloides TaxID=1746091 RepID=A0AAV7YM30_9EUKA|nr:protein c10 [Anaeramoeba flamelloides]KAJ6235968.1 protein c10 [Anaeramoeba flamelloides]|eukprot:Anaeramoba_flamelloidesc40752_g1_i3.p1 GENE.c40752_g1_i3~~c40752_g1_i3.p1  ORF type:complete len:115 (-),score=45.52 c40752_g1_i3:395-718(-)